MGPEAEVEDLCDALDLGLEEAEGEMHRRVPEPVRQALQFRGTPRRPLTPNFGRAERPMRPMTNFARSEPSVESAPTDATCFLVSPFSCFV